MTPQADPTVLRWKVKAAITKGRRFEPRIAECGKLGVRADFDVAWHEALPRDATNFVQHPATGRCVWRFSTRLEGYRACDYNGPLTG